MEDILIATDDVTALPGNTPTCATQLDQLKDQKKKICEVLTIIEYQYTDGIYHYNSTRTIYNNNQKLHTELEWWLLKTKKWWCTLNNPWENHSTTPTPQLKQDEDQYKDTLRPKVLYKPELNPIRNPIKSPKNTQHHQEILYQWTIWTRTMDTAN